MQWCQLAYVINTNFTRQQNNRNVQYDVNEKKNIHIR